MIILAGSLVLLASFFFNSILQTKTKPATLLSLYLLSYANIVLAGEITNIFHVLNRQWAFILVHFLIVLVGFFLWLKKGSPNLLGPFQNWREELKKEKLLLCLKNWPDLALFTIGTIAILSLAAIMILKIPPNNNDSLSTHLSRVGYWLQFGSFLPWPTSRTFQLVYPINAQLQMFWSILFTGSDKLVGFTQWLTALATAVGIFGISRLLGWGRSASAFAGLAFLSYPLVVLQSTTTQNDLVAAGLFVPAVYLLLLGVQENHRGALILSASSVALGLGTKQTFYFLLPGLGISILLVYKKYGKPIFRNILFWGMSLLFAFIGFASYINITNWHHFGTPFGPPKMMEKSVGGEDINEITNHLAYNIPRLLYQAIDTSGLPRPLNGYGHKAKAKISEYIFNAIDFEIEGTQYTAPGHEFLLSEQNQPQEDHAWYGLVSALFLFPAMVHQLIKGIRTKEWIRVGLVFNFISFLVVTAWLRPGWDPYQGRYFAPVIALNTPLIAEWFNSTRKAYFARWSLVILSLIIATTTALYNPAKPMIGKFSDRVDVWNASRIDIQTIQSSNRRQMLLLIDKEVPSNAILGIYTPSYILDYPLFGEYFTRRLIPVYPLENLENNEWLEEQGIEYLLIQSPTNDSLSLPSDLELINISGTWALYKRERP